MQNPARPLIGPSRSEVSTRTPGPIIADDGAQYTEDFFVYGVGPLTVAAGASALGNFQVEANSLFLWDRASYFATIANAAFDADTQPIPNVAIQITDSGSGRQLFRTPQPIPSVFGFGGLPFVLPQPRYFERNSLVQVELSNFDAAVTYIIRLSFLGSKLFKSAR